MVGAAVVGAAVVGAAVVGAAVVAGASVAAGAVVGGAVVGLGAGAAGFLVVTTRRVVFFAVFFVVFDDFLVVFVAAFAGTIALTTKAVKQIHQALVRSTRVIPLECPLRFSHSRTIVCTRSDFGVMLK